MAMLTVMIDDGGGDYNDYIKEAVHNNEHSNDFHKVFFLMRIMIIMMMIMMMMTMIMIMRNKIRL